MSASDWTTAVVPAALCRESAILDTATGKVERHAAVTVPPDGGLEAISLDLARFALGDAPPALTVVPLAPVLEARPLPPPTQSGSNALATTKWTALGTTAVLGIAAGVLAISASADRTKVDDANARWGGRVPPEQISQVNADTDSARRSIGAMGS